MDNTSPDVEQYILQFPIPIQDRMREIRKVIRQAAPNAEEVISYQMPAYKQNGMLVYFAAFKNHIGFFPTASGIAAFKDQLSFYKTTKGTIRFPHDKSLPFSLIEEIVKFRVLENLGKKKIGKE